MPKNIMDYIPPAQWAAIEAGNSTFDCYPSWLQAVDALSARGGKITAPPGDYHFGQTLHWKKYTWLEGEGSGQANGEATWFTFPTNVSGIVVHTSKTGPTGIVPTGPGADASVISHIGVKTAARGSTGHGIHLRARAEVSNVLAADFGQDGVHIEASWNGDDATLGNANNWHVERCRLLGNGRHGLYADGADVNAGNAIAVDASLNGGWGFFDSSFLGNTFIGCHTAGNASGPYCTDNQNARSVFLGCYSESGQPPSKVVHPSKVIGGLHAAGFTDDSTGQRIGDTMTPFSVLTRVGSRTVGFDYGLNGAAVTMAAWGEGGSIQVGQWNEVAGTFDDTWANLDYFRFLRRTTLVTTIKDEQGNKLPQGEIILSRGHWVGLGSDGNSPVARKAVD